MARGQNKEKLLESGLTLFYQQGFSATGVQEITSHAGVPKGSFYNYFASKEDFVTQVLALYTDWATGYLEENLMQGPGSPLARFRRLFETWSCQFFPEMEAKGCLAGNLSQELSNTHPEVREALAHEFPRMLHYYKAILRAAQECGELSATQDTDSLASLIYDAWQGATLRAKALRNTSPFEHFLDQIFDRYLGS
ncbi:TetR/AcrR family transcriptional regulator [Rhodovibrionaceae bacterium A322]